MPTIDAPTLAAHVREFPRRWESRAACQNAADLFFSPLVGEDNATRLSREDAAKRVCARCEVIDACRCYALRAREPIGIWGGLTATERRALLSEDSV